MKKSLLAIVFAAALPLAFAQNTPANQGSTAKSTSTTKKSAKHHKKSSSKSTSKAGASAPAKQ